MKKYLVFVVALFSLFLVNTKAAELSSDNFGLSIDNNNLPYEFVLNNSTKRMGVYLYSFESQKNYTYLVFDVCATDGLDNLKVTNAAYNSYFNDNSAIGVWTDQKCTVSSYTARVYKLQMKVGKFGDFDDAGEIYASSYLQFSFSGYYNAFYKFSNAYLSDVDVVTPLLNASNDSKKQQEIINKQTETNSKLDDVKSKQDEAEKTRKGILGKVGEILTSIVNLPKKIVDLVVDGLKSLFIPDDTEFITNFVDSIENKLGFIAEVPISVINFGLGLVNASWTEVTSISFPSINIFGYYFWDAQEIDITTGINIFKPYKYITDVLCVVLCVATLNKWREKFTGGGS